MTKQELKCAQEKLEAAKAMSLEIDMLDALVGTLDHAIKPFARSSEPRKLTLWFGNKETASVILFDNHTLSDSGLSLPVTPEFLTYIRKYFADRLDTLSEEFQNLELK